MNGNMVAAEQRVTELRAQMERQSKAVEELRTAGEDRVDALRRLRTLTNALELIRPRIA
jgi:hypothetical protein